MSETVVWSVEWLCLCVCTAAGNGHRHMHGLAIGANVYIILSRAESMTATTSNYLIRKSTRYSYCSCIIRCTKYCCICSPLYRVRVCVNAFLMSLPPFRSIHSFFPLSFALRLSGRFPWAQRANVSSFVCLCVWIRFYAHVINTIHHILQNNRE